jgi:NADP-dependent 3-hydroxy acid dehydrogenase YdfG
MKIVLEDTDNEVITEENEAENITLDGLKSEVEAQPDNLRLRLRYAVALAQLQNNWQAATKQTTFVLDKDPNNPDANYLLGEMAEVNNDAYLAQTYYEKVANVSPYYPNIYVKIAELSASNFPAQTKQTKKHFKKAIEADEANTTLLYSYATFLNEKDKNVEKAIKYFQKTLKLAPEHPFANYDLALIYYALGDRYAAQNFYEKAAANNPEFKTAANDEVFKIIPILSEERAQEAILAGAELDPEVEKFNRLIDNTYDSPNTNIEAPTFAEEISDAMHTSDIIELAKPIPPKTSPNANAKIALITGATSGIGRATAEILAKDGWNLILTGRREERLSEMTAHFNVSYSGTSMSLVFDVQNLPAVENAVQSLDNEWINIDVLLNNAGLGLGLSPIHEGDIRQWDTMIDTNIKGLLYMTRLVAPKMVENKSGHIINICSTAGKEAYPNGNVYCATKFAVDALTKSMRIDLHQHNIRVSQVAPGAVEETEFSLVRFEGDAERAEKVYQNFQALRASDVAEVLHFIINRPAHVNIQDVLLMGTQQASASIIDRSGR